jgi:hypothetical protein
MVPASYSQEISMEREIRLLSVNELGDVVGGRMNDGKQQLINKDQRGVPGSNPDPGLWKEAVRDAFIFVVVAGGALGIATSS